MLPRMNFVLVCLLLILSLTACTLWSYAAADANNVGGALSLIDNEVFKLVAIDMVGVGFDLELISKVDYDLCVPEEAWPMKNGRLAIGYSHAAVYVGERVIWGGLFNPGYSPSGYGYLKLAPYGRLSGYIDYSEFDIPDDMHDFSSKSLVFTVFPRPCQ